MGVCEHHMLPFFGQACVGVLAPGGVGTGVLGLSKYGRILDLFSARLQVQERLTEEVAQAVWDSYVKYGGYGNRTTTSNNSRTVTSVTTVSTKNINDGRRTLSTVAESDKLSTHGKKNNPVNLLSSCPEVTDDSLLCDLGVAVVLRNVTHTCMSCRGSRKIGSVTTTSAFRGELARPGSSWRREFMEQINTKNL